MSLPLEFGLLERPVFHIKQIGFSDWLETADFFGGVDDPRGLLTEIGDNPCAVLIFA